MAPTKLTEVISYSSEDSNFPAENLLKTNTVSSWKCKSGVSEKQSYVILKLDKLSQIGAIDIGNEHSAFVEVLVGRDGIDFQVLLVASSFMSPLESRSSTETRRVRMFRKDKLNKVVMDQKWDRIKVICTQPFNKSVQYGLSFVKVVSGDQEDASSSQNSSGLRLGSYILKEEETNTSDLSPGSFFAKRKEKESPLGGAAAIRAASNAAMASYNSSAEPNKRSIETLGNVQDGGFYQLKKVAKTTPSSENSTTKTPERKKECVPNSLKKEKVDTTKAVKNEEEENPPKQKERDSKEESKKVETATRKEINGSQRSKERIKRQSRPFGQLMKGVIFVMSGYQNPQRSDLRDKLLEMGAKYKNDWDDKCTHLICAFANTPKFQAVKGKGKIVTQKWIEECYKRKIRLPWRRYNLEKNRNADESEEEVWATELLTTNEENGVKVKVEDSKEQSRVEESYDAETDEDEVDTDEEVQRILAKEGNSPFKVKNSEPPKNDAGENTDDDYDADTDVDEDKEVCEDVKFSLPVLESYFKNSNFFIYDDVTNEKRREICRYIVAYDGKVFDYMDKKVNFVITDSTWDEHFDEALTSSPTLQFVKSQWIWKCCDKQKFIPPQPYLIMPAIEDSD